MNTFRSLTGLRGMEEVMPEKHGVLYLLITSSMFKIGATTRPVARITEQQKIGDFRSEEFVTQIEVTTPLRDFKQIESELKRAAYWALRFQARGIHAGGRPREIFHLYVLDMFRSALLAAEEGDAQEVQRLVEEIEVVCRRKAADRLRGINAAHATRRTSAATETAARRATPRKAPCKCKGGKNKEAA